MGKRAQKRRFGTIVAELEGLREWLKQEGVTHVVMESTASYWKPVFNILETDFQVYLANPEEVKNRKGHKTDDKDGWWLPEARVARAKKAAESMTPEERTARAKKAAAAAVAARRKKSIKGT